MSRAKEKFVLSKLISQCAKPHFLGIIQTMSGHSHFATIKRKKESEDAKRGAIFSRLSKTISIAIKAGGSANLDTNYKLRVAIDQAKMVNMPKSNIERILAKASQEGSLTEVLYEGYGPFNIAVIVEAATDNRNRTGQEIKNIFEKAGGNLGGPGSVSFNFEPKGIIVVEKDSDVNLQMLEIIDFGVDDVVDVPDELEVYVRPEDTFRIKEKIEEKLWKVKSFSLIQKPKNVIIIDDKDKALKIYEFLENFEEHDDVSNVFSNADINREIAESLR